MIVDAVRLVSSWMTDGSGVNADLPTVPRTAPEPAPAAVTHYNQNDHPWVARIEVPKELLQLDGAGNPRSLLLVLLHPDPQGFVAQFLPEYEAEAHTIIPVVVAFVCRKIEQQGSA